MEKFCPECAALDQRLRSESAVGLLVLPAQNAASFARAQEQFGQASARVQDHVWPAMLDHEAKTGHVVCGSRDAMHRQMFDPARRTDAQLTGLALAACGVVLFIVVAIVVGAH